MIISSTNIASKVFISISLYCSLVVGKSINSKLIIGLNKYSHDASCCIVNSADGNILFAQSKERLTHRKHDGGSVGDLVQYGLNYIGATVNDVDIVVSNNHHHRVLPYEKRLPFYEKLNYCPRDYLDPLNLFPGAKHLELSHHLAHAWSVMGTAPFNKGLILVMDGMGESFRAMLEDMKGIEDYSGDYMHDMRLIASQKDENFVGVPYSLSPSSGYREAETAYLFENMSLRPVFKRWSRERSPPELYNHGFENMESLGAVYSRISSHIFGDWNACGKVMGLAPWAGKKLEDTKGWYFNADKRLQKEGSREQPFDIGAEFHHSMSVMSGNPYDGSFEVRQLRLSDNLCFNV